MHAFNQNTKSGTPVQWTGEVPVINQWQIAYSSAATGPQTPPDALQSAVNPTAGVDPRPSHNISHGGSQLLRLIFSTTCNLPEMYAMHVAFYLHIACHVYRAYDICLPVSVCLQH